MAETDCGAAALGSRPGKTSMAMSPTPVRLIALQQSWNRIGGHGDPGASVCEEREPSTNRRLAAQRS
jgi:hypothetical protein